MRNVWFFSLFLCLFGCCGNSANKDSKGLQNKDASAVKQCQQCADVALKQENSTYKKTLAEEKVVHQDNVAKIKAQRKACITTEPTVPFNPVNLGETPEPNGSIVPPEPQTPPLFSEAGVDLTDVEKADVQAIASVKTTDNIRNRVVCLGDNFPGLAAELHYCVFDMQKSAVRHFEKLGFKKEEIRLITNAELTAEGMKKWIAWAMADTQPGDKRGVFMSMHGAEDTDASGKIIQIPVTYDMISTGNWSPATEIEPGWLTAQIQTVCDGCNVLIVMDLCHAGGVRPLLRVTRTGKSVVGPEYVVQRTTVATQTSKAFANINTLNCTFIPMCGAGQLSEESSNTGGAGTWAFWRAIDKLGPNARAVDIVKEMRIDLRANAFSQTPECLGKYALKPIYQTN